MAYELHRNEDYCSDALNSNQIPNNIAKEHANAVPKTQEKYHIIQLPLNILINIFCIVFNIPRRYFAA